MFVVEEALKLLFKTIAARFLQALVVLAIMTILAGKNINLQMDAITLLQNACLLVGTYISFHVISTIIIRIVVIPKFSSHKAHVQTTIKRVGDLAITVALWFFVTLAPDTWVRVMGIIGLCTILVLYIFIEPWWRDRRSREEPQLTKSSS